MYFFIQTILIHQFGININIIRSRINQNRNNLITKLIVHLDNICQVIHLHVIQCYMDSRNAFSNIPNCVCFLCTIYMRHTALIQQKILLEMFLATFPTLQLSLTITFIVLPSRLSPMSLSDYIKLLVRNHILFLTYILRSFSLWWPLSLSFVFPFPTMPRFFLTL